MPANKPVKKSTKPAAKTKAPAAKPVKKHGPRADFGKPIALERLGMKGRYYSIDAGGWHLVALDNIQPRGKGYFATLDDEQQAWLERDLAKNMSGERLPVLVLTHIPLCTVCSMFFARGGENGETFYRVNDNMMHNNAKPLLRQLAANNVKLCL